VIAGSISIIAAIIAGFALATPIIGCHLRKIPNVLFADRLPCHLTTGPSLRVRMAYADLHARLGVFLVIVEEAVSTVDALALGHQ
jgi:hypothetical protein